MIAGVDEAGRGPLAGPVVAAAVILCERGIVGVADSKKLSEMRRSCLADEIRSRCLVGVGVATVAEIDQRNILWATMLAMERAVAALGVECREVLVDGNRTPKWPWPSRAIIGGDVTEPCISAASIIAKVTRDAIMIEADGRYPGYGWATNKGYGSAKHLAALDEIGPSPLHRRSFAPVAKAYLRN